MHIKSRKRGFSLVEVAITLVVIAVLAAIAVPILARVVGNSQEGAARANAESIAREANADGLSSSEGTVNATIVERAAKALFPDENDALTTNEDDDDVTVTVNDGCKAEIDVESGRAVVESVKC